MADRILTNIAGMDGSYGDVPFENEPSTEVTVTLAEVSFTKTVDKTVWLNGQITFTLTVDNTDGVEDFSNIVITDQLDTTAVEYVANSLEVTIDGTELVINTDYTFTYAAGLLTVTFIQDIPAGSTAEISFRGNKVATP